jgi:hypothetical protein
VRNEHIEWFERFAGRLVGADVRSGPGKAATMNIFEIVPMAAPALILLGLRVLK